MKGIAESKASPNTMMNLLECAGRELFRGLPVCEAVRVPGRWDIFYLYFYTKKNMASGDMSLSVEFRFDEISEFGDAEKVVDHVHGKVIDHVLAVFHGLLEKTP